MAFREGGRNLAFEFSRTARSTVFLDILRDKETDFHFEIQRISTMNRLDETAQKESSTGKGLSDSGYKTEPNTSQGNATVTSEADIGMNYEEICKALAPEIRPGEYRRVTVTVEPEVVEKDLFLQRIMINEALLPLRMTLPEGTSKTGLLLKVMQY